MFRGDDNKIFGVQVVLEQLSRPEERRCPIARASIEIVQILSEHWAIYAPGCMSL